jgi:hypothetical protein
MGFARAGKRDGASDFICIYENPRVIEEGFVSRWIFRNGSAAFFDMGAFAYALGAHGVIALDLEVRLALK